MLVRRIRATSPCRDSSCSTPRIAAKAANAHHTRTQQAGSTTTTTTDFSSVLYFRRTGVARHGPMPGCHVRIRGIDMRGKRGNAARYHPLPGELGAVANAGRGSFKMQSASHVRESLIQRENECVKPSREATNAKPAMLDMSITMADTMADTVALIFPPLTNHVAVKWKLVWQQIRAYMKKTNGS